MSKGPTHSARFFKLNCCNYCKAWDSEEASLDVPFCRSVHALVDMRCELNGVDRLLAVLEGNGDVDEH